MMGMMGRVLVEIVWSGCRFGTVDVLFLLLDRRSKATIVSFVWTTSKQNTNRRRVPD